MADRFAKVEQGDPLRIPAEAYNALMDVAREFFAGQYDQLSEAARRLKQTTIIPVRSDADRNAYDVLKLDGVVFSETDNLSEFQQRTSWSGTVPTTTTDTICILLEPCAEGRYARAVIAGVATVQVDVTDEAHEFANPTANDATQLTSGATGLHRILYKPEGTGTLWCKVRLADGSGGTAVEFVKCTSATATGSLYPGVLQNVNASTGALTDASSGTLTPNSTDTGADTVSFASAHGWTTGMLVQPVTTGGGLTAGTQYWINATDLDTISFHTSLADAESGSNKVNLTASITSALDQVGVWLRFPNDEVPTDGTKYGAVQVGMHPTNSVAILEGLHPISSGGSFDQRYLAEGVLAASADGSAVGSLPMDEDTIGPGPVNTLRYYPLLGNRITVYNGSAWVIRQFTAPTVTAGSADTNYDIFGVSNGSGLTDFVIERVAWTNATTRATALAFQDGVYVKSGDATRRYLGTIRTDGSGNFIDHPQFRYVWNLYNQRRRRLIVQEATASWSAAGSGTGWRPMRNQTANRVEFVIGLRGSSSIRMSSYCTASGTSDTFGMQSGIALNSTTANHAQLMHIGNIHTPNHLASEWHSKASELTAGYHFIQWVEALPGATGGTFFGSNLSGMMGDLWC